MKTCMSIAIGILFSVLCIPLAAYQVVPTDEKDVQTPESEMKAEEILGHLIAVNEHEIAAANAALEKKGDQKIAQYAEMMKQDHTKSLEETKKLAAALTVEPALPSDVGDLKTEGVTNRSELAKLSGTAFDHAYIDQMVSDHTKVLNLIDTKLKNTSNPQLQEHLKKTRAEVARHLEEAKRIQDEIK